MIMSGLIAAGRHRPGVPDAPEEPPGRQPRSPASPARRASCRTSTGSTRSTRRRSSRRCARIGRVFFAIDRIVVDGVIWAVGFVPQLGGFALKLTTQRGYLQGYAGAMAFGIAGDPADRVLVSASRAMTVIRGK